MIEKNDNDSTQVPFLELLAKVYTYQEKYSNALNLYQQCISILKL